MKIWIRLLIGIALGGSAVFFLPGYDGELLETLSDISRFIIHVGRYVIFPLVLFSLAIGTYRLREERRLLSVYARTGIMIILTSVALVLLGALSVILLSPERIPIIIEEAVPYAVPDVRTVLFSLFPKNLFQLFSGNGDFLLPLYLLSLFLGLVFSYDKRISEPVILLCDSLSRVFYNMNRFVTEILGIGMIFLSAYLVLQLRSVVELELFRQLLLILAVDAGIVILLLYPVLMYFLGDRRPPFRWLYGIIGPALTAFFSGDSYFSLGILMRHGRENLGIPRRSGSTTFPLYAIFGHAGTAMVACVSFIVILRSYSSLELTFPQILLAMMYSFGVSFLLGPVPGKGAMVALYLLSAFHGRGLEDGYLILRPIAPLLISAGVLLDVVTSAFVSTVVARQEDVADVEVEPAVYI